MNSFTHIQRTAWSLTALLLLVALALIFTATVQAAAPVDGGGASADSELGSEATAERVHNRIGLIGGRMVADMAKYGYFETALTALWTDQDITFRTWAGQQMTSLGRRARSSGPASTPNPGNLPPTLSRALAMRRCLVR